MITALRNRIECLVLQIQADFLDHPRLALTLPAAERRFGVDEVACASVLGALEETEGSLVTYGRAQTRRDLLTEAAAASARAADLARQRFQGGLTDFVNVLEAERDALAVQDNLAQSHTQTATALVAVYKALGGGWSDEATP